MILKSTEILRIARKAKGFSQLEVATQYGCSKNTYQRWESGAVEPPYYHVHGIVEMLGYTVRELEDAKLLKLQKNIAA